MRFTVVCTLIDNDTIGSKRCASVYNLQNKEDKVELGNGSQ